MRRSSKRSASRSRATKPRPARTSQRAFARMLGVDPKAVRKGIRNGRLRESLDRDKRIRDVELARREWVEGAAKPPNGGGHEPKPTNGNGAAGQQLQLPEQRTLVEAQLRLSAQRTAALELDNQRRRGQLLDAAVVQRDQFEAARIVRDAVLGVPDRIAAELAGETDPRRVYELLADELKRALTSIATELERG